MQSKVDLMTGTSPTALQRPNLRGARPTPNESPSQRESQLLIGASQTAAPSADYTETDAFDGSHLDNIELPPDLGGDTGDDAPNAAPAETLIGKEEFFSTFSGLFMIGYLPKPFPLPLVSLPIKPEEMDAARRASDALYDIILEVHFLRWILSPQGEWAGRIIAIGTFAVPKAMAVMAEIRAKERERQEAKMRDVSPRRAPETTSVNSQATQEL